MAGKSGRNKMNKLIQRVNDWYVVNVREALRESWSLLTFDDDYSLDDKFIESSRRSDRRALARSRRAYDRVDLKSQTI